MARINAVPERFWERLARIVPKDRYGQVVESFSAPRAVGFRVNTLHADPSRTVASLGFETRSLDWLADGFVVAAEDRERLLESPGVRDGALWVQNPSSMIPPVVLDPQPDDVVLDLAAAPGSKTLQMACAMGSGADIAAVEMVRSRFYRLKRNLRAQGAGFVKTFNRDGIRVSQYRPDHFDRVLIDAPCSTEGRMRPDEPDTFRHWSERKIRTMAGKQRLLLESAIRCAKPGGVVVYSTCSFAPEENEGVVQYVLDVFGSDVEVEPIDLDLPGRQVPLGEWRGVPYDEAVGGAMRVLPDGVFEAFFVCRIRRVG
jgi:tRNA (cytosine49-C5)-methyltransferase